MRGNRVVVLHVPAGGGHKAAALAVAESARLAGLEPVVIDALSLAPAWFARAYVETHLQSSAHLPTFYGGAFFATNRRSKLGDELRYAVDHWLGKRILREVLSHDPAAVVATHFFPLMPLGRARTKGELGAPLVSVVTDYGAHAVWVTSGVDFYCAPAGGSCRDLVRHGAPADRVVPTGIPVGRTFGEIERLRSPRRDEPLRVLVTSGGFGVGPMARVLRSFAGAPEIELTVVCGDNPRLRARARGLAAKLALDAEVVGFERDMPGRIARAHLVVGKPGGLTVSECLAAGRAMVLVGAVPGQESLNQRWIVGAGAAIACSPSDVGAEVAALRARGAVGPMGARARSLGAPLAADLVVQTTLAAARAAGEPRAA